MTLDEFNAFVDKCAAELEGYTKEEFYGTEQSLWKHLTDAVRTELFVQEIEERAERAHLAELMAKYPDVAVQFVKTGEVPKC